MARIFISHVSSSADQWRKVLHSYFSDSQVNSPSNAALTEALFGILSSSSDVQMITEDDEEFLAKGKPEAVIESDDFQIIRTPGLIGLDGQALTPTTNSTNALVESIKEANSLILAKLKTNANLVYQLTDRQFEEISAELFEKLGYDVTLTPASKDGGKDLYIAKKDELGSFIFFVECKHYSRDHPVGVKLVRELYGVIEQTRATAGLLVTSSTFTKGAKDFVEPIRHRMSLKDYQDFQAMIRKAGF